MFQMLSAACSCVARTRMRTVIRDDTLRSLSLLLLTAQIVSPFACFPRHLSRRTDAFLLRSTTPGTEQTAVAGDEREDDFAYSYGDGMDQEAMMENDMLVAVDAHDRTVDTRALPGRPPSLSKKAAHAFNPDQPRGVAHRAFSIFLFNGKNELLLTRRAPTKVTFPGVWTNTCCSHPIHGQTPDEVDDGVADFPAFPGIKHAARRKLWHELGIHPRDVPHEDFRFLTRFHYWAADTKTYGDNAPWGEHEVDYVLFIRCDDAPIVRAHPEEVSEFKFVSAGELKEMMDEDGVEWSPWFRGIMERGGFEWWESLEECLMPESRYCNRDITFFDPPKDFVAAFNLPEHGQGTGVLSKN